MFTEPSGEANDLISIECVLYPFFANAFNFLMSASLFSVVLISDSEVAADLKRRNRERNLTITEMKELKE